MTRREKTDTFYNQAVAETKYGFKSYRDFNFNMSLNTQLFGMFQFKNSKKLKAIRHTIRPAFKFKLQSRFYQAVLEV